ncbi:UDP-N-acetylglucosamine 2-epimerase [Hyphomicrobium sulfonivorans]|uniref:UDP-N-acetylglucosamine 2-epimerase n=1 Tax=Hyphomicrobium sulfonivorans TaxID=121290 RepID=A0A120CX77_HYPSL|nr:UDP-N-acetylglucosamine 2-epimerase (non-hydrolyzing) [Hyphomicrobium sulfonivorans]KWT70543.1 UDP-N-acetylglucosamine 2-epimerase [Hyphomicrobium sulfonivorans]
MSKPAKTIVTIVGARPQFIKVAPVSRALRDTGSITEILVHTGQHFDANMSDVFFDELGIARPDYNLDVGGGGHGAMTGLMLQRIEPLLQDIRPDAVLIYGDTNSTLAGALTAAKLHIPVAHIEAGLRSFNRAMPEEINRVVADHLSELLFASTDVAVANLLHEGVDAAKVHHVGDVMYDAALLFADRAKERTLLADLGLEPGRYVLSTLHRAENTDSPQRLGALVAALDRVAQQIPVVLPLHPRTRGAMERQGLRFERVKTIDPVGYLDMIALESNAAVIATDSGGVQKEAFFYAVPCVTLRDETEWTELIELGWNQLAAPDGPAISEQILSAVGRKGTEAFPYGNGDAARLIAEKLAG